MRAVRVGDLDEALRVLLAAPQPEWPEVARHLLEKAHCADRYRKRLGKIHPRWGDGSLMSLARLRVRAEYPARHDAQAVAALTALLHAIATWRNERAVD